MKIRIKAIEHERLGDAPFIGCLISSIDCHINCKNCFNQHLKTYPTTTMECSDIIKEVKSNPFNEGIILGGLEWTEQPEEMIELIDMAIENQLKVILYSGLSEKIFKKKFPQVYSKKILFKFGDYRDNERTAENIQYGVSLASKNQNILKNT